LACWPGLPWPNSGAGGDDRPGGITAWLVEEPAIPFVALEIRFRGGATLDAPGKEGAVNLMAGLLEEGTGDLDSQGFAAARDASGGKLPVRGLARGGFGFGAVPVGKPGRAVDLLRRALVEPAFAPADGAGARAGAGRAAQDARTPRRGRWPLTALAFGDHAYARPTDGTLGVRGGADGRRYARGACGALARDRVLWRRWAIFRPPIWAPMLDALLGALPETGAPCGRACAGGPDRAGGGGAVSGPAIGDLFGHEGIRRDDPDFFAAFVVSEILGGGRFGTRLMTEVREKRGLTYGIGAGLSMMDQAALVAGQVQTANATVQPDHRRDPRRMGRMPRHHAGELDAVKTYLTGRLSAAVGRQRQYRPRAGRVADGWLCPRLSDPPQRLYRGGDAGGCAARGRAGVRSRSAELCGGGQPVGRADRELAPGFALLYLGA
jgi:zinc protease